jgi:hypothetical protein
MESMQPSRGCLGSTTATTIAIASSRTTISVIIDVIKVGVAGILSDSKI